MFTTVPWVRVMVLWSLKRTSAPPLSVFTVSPLASPIPGALIRVSVRGVAWRETKTSPSDFEILAICGPPSGPCGNSTVMGTEEGRTGMTSDATRISRGAMRLVAPSGCRSRMVKLPARLITRSSFEGWAVTVPERLLSSPFGRICNCGVTISKSVPLGKLNAMAPLLTAIFKGCPRTISISESSTISIRPRPTRMTASLSF